MSFSIAGQKVNVNVREYEHRWYLVIDTPADIPIWLDLIEQYSYGNYHGMLRRISPTALMKCRLEFDPETGKWECPALPPGIGYHTGLGIWIPCTYERAEVEAALIAFFSGDVSDTSRYELDHYHGMMLGTDDVAYMPVEEAWQ